MSAAPRRAGRIGQQHGPVLWQAGQHVGQEVQRRPRPAAGLQDLGLHQAYPVGQIGGGLVVAESRQPLHVFGGLGQVATAQGDGGEDRHRE